MKALEKDRGRRYETANGLARDLQRYLEGKPLEAVPPSAALPDGQPVIGASIRDKIGAVYVDLSVYGEAQHQYERALVLRTARTRREARGHTLHHGKPCGGVRTEWKV